MPTYEYACKECGEHLEVQQSFSDAALTECPACHGPLRKVFGNIAITFKGSGFYKNDSRSSSTTTKTSDTTTPSTSDTAAKPAEKTEKTAAPEKSTPKPAAEKAAS